MRRLLRRLLALDATLDATLEAAPVLNGAAPAAVARAAAAEQEARRLEAAEEADTKAFCDKETSESKAKQAELTAKSDKSQVRIEKATATIAELKQQMAAQHKRNERLRLERMIVTAPAFPHTERGHFVAEHKKKERLRQYLDRQVNENTNR